MALENRLVMEHSQDDVSIWLGIEDGLETGMAILRPSPWESEQLGFPCAILELHMQEGDVSTRMATASLLIHEAVSGCRMAGVRFLTTKVLSDRFPIIHSLEDAGFRLMDTEMLLLAKHPSESLIEIPGVRFELRNQELVDGIEKIESLFSMNRIYSDSRIADSEAKALWQRSIIDSCKGYADEYLLANSDQGPLGIITFKYDTSLQEFCDQKICSFFRIGSRKGQKHIGLEVAMMSQGIRMAEKKAAHIIVETQSRNAAALKLCQDSGFEIIDSRFSFHLWLS